MKAVMLQASPEDIVRFLTRLFDPSCLKWSIILAITVVTNFILAAPTFWQSLFFAFPILVFLDLVTGMFASVKVRKVRLSSYLAGKSLVKLFCYSVVFLVALIIEEVTGTPYVVSTITLSLIATTEGLSILENTRLLWESTGYSWPFNFLADKVKELSKVLPTEFKNGLPDTLMTEGTEDTPQPSPNPRTPPTDEC